MLLEQINEPNDIKKLDTTDYDVLAEEILVGNGSGYEKDWTINGESATISVEKLV